TREAVQRRGLEPESRVVLRMSDDDNERTAALAEDCQTSRHELRADALPLSVREDGHRSQSHSEDSPPHALDNHGRKEDVTDNGIVFSHQRQRVMAGLPQSLDEVCLRRLTE